MDSSRLHPKSSYGPPTPGLRLPAALLALAFAAQASCSNEDITTIGFRLVGPPEPLSDGRCPAGADPASPEFGEVQATDVLRLTYRISGGGDLLCDVALDLGGENPVIGIPKPGGAPDSDLHVDVFAEYFREAGGDVVLLGSGATREVDLGAGGVVDIRVTPSNRSSCASERASVARAFHSATPLPNGEVLILGGAVASASGAAQVTIADDTAALYATASAEIFDPQTGAFREVSIPGLLPRALHTAVVLTNAGPEIRVALIGGLTVAGDSAETPVLVSAGETARFRLVAAEGALGAPVEILTYDLSSSRITRELLHSETFEPARRVLGSGSSTDTPEARPVPLLVGGWANATMAGAVDTFETLDPNTSQPVATEPLRAERFGATVTDLGDGSALLWGGQLDSAPSGLVQDAGELLLGLDTSSPTSSTLAFTGPVTPSPRAFHQAARAGDGSVLVVGGFLIASDGRALAPSTIHAQRLELGPVPELSDVAVAGGGAGVPAGYLGAVALADGDVLVCGGNPELGHAGCPQDIAGLVCSLPDVLRYRTSSSAFERAGDLIVGRYGHAITRLADGKVLITGGIHASGSALEVLADAELFDPRELDDDPIADLGPAIERAPGDIVRDSTGEPVSECARVEAE